MEVENFEAALIDFNVALTLSPSESEITMLNEKIAACIHERGKIHLDKGNIDEAVEDFNRAINHPDATPLTKCKAIMSHIKAGVISDTAIAPPPFPSDIREWCNNTLLHKASSELDSAGPLKEAAVKFMRNFCAWDYKGNDLDMAEVLALFHFNPNNQGLHENGSLYSGDMNCTPRSPTSGPFCEIWARTWSYVFKLNLKDANALTMQQVAWGDIINLDGDSDEATNSAKSAKFDEMVEETELLNLEFILENIDQLPNVKYMIICSNAAWEFYQKHKSKFPSRIKVLQNRSLVHTCLMSQTIGITYRQAFALVNAIVDIQSKLVGLETPPTVTEELVRSIIGAKINKRTSDQFVYVGICNGKIVLCASGCDAFLQLLIDEGAPTTDFPNQATIQSNMENGIVTEHAGLEVEIHPFNSAVVASLNTGPQDHVNKSEYDRWYKCSEKRQAYTGDRISGRDTNVFVAIYNKEIIFYSPDGVRELRRMLRKEGATFRQDTFPNQKELENGQGYEVVKLELTIKMYASNSVEAAKFSDAMKPGPQESDKFKEWKDKRMTNAELILHSVKPDTIEVANWFDDSITSIRQLNDGKRDVNKESGIKISGDSQNKLNKSLGKIGLKFGDRGSSAGVEWDKVDKAKASINGRKSMLVWLNVNKDTDGATRRPGRGRTSYQLPFILSGLQLEPGHEASVVLDENGIEVTKKIHRSKSFGDVCNV